MRNKKKRKKYKKPFSMERINLKYPSIFAAVYLIFVGVLMIYSGTIYTYYWILLPRGALSLWSFVLLFIVFFVALGTLTAWAITGRSICCRVSKRIIILSLSATSILTLLWYDCIFSAHAFFPGFIISLIMLLCMVLGFLISINKYKLMSFGFGVMLMWYIYLFWFSFCIMLIN